MDCTNWAHVIGMLSFPLTVLALLIGVSLVAMWSR